MGTRKGELRSPVWGACTANGEVRLDLETGVGKGVQKSQDEAQNAQTQGEGDTELTLECREGEEKNKILPWSFICIPVKEKKKHE